MRIGVWGATSSGKTTFLAALDTATLREREGQWRMLPKDLVAEDFLVAQKASLEQGVFPDATLRRSPEYTFTISGDVDERIDRNTWRGKHTQMEHRHVEFELLVRDFPGRDFQREAQLRTGEPSVEAVAGAVDDAPAEAVRQQAFEDVGKFLANCDGIIYLFDPVREQQQADNIQYFQRPLLTTVRLVREAHRLVSSPRHTDRLPMWLAVCITKYDDWVIYQRLRQSGLLQWTNLYYENTPVLTNGRRAFELLAHKDVVNYVDRFFDPQRVEYFGISSVGFYADDQGRIDADDWGNVIDTYGGTRVRGEFAPVNVLHPVRWIERGVRGGGISPTRR